VWGFGCGGGGFLGGGGVCVVGGVGWVCGLGFFVVVVVWVCVGWFVGGGGSSETTWEGRNGSRAEGAEE